MHHFMGFHDGTAINPSNGALLVLEVDEMLRPPTKDDRARLLITTWEGEIKSEVGVTAAWNFPQGARQQWVDSETIVHNRSSDRECVGVVTSLAAGTELVLEKPIYVVDRQRRTGWGLNFARLHRLGGYGYVGLADETAHSEAPGDDGLWEVDLQSGRASLRVSIEQVVGCRGLVATATGAHHYLTHVVPSPNGSRLAFLHRYWLADGGIHTRLITCSASGNEIECWAEGFLSHFDWWDDEAVLIWGRPLSRLQATRSHPALSLPGVRQLATWSKPLLRRLLRRRGGLTANYLIARAGDSPPQTFANGVLTEDGHPSFRPTDRGCLLTDTYPDESGWRTLMLCDLHDPQVQRLGRFQQAQVTPDTSNFEKAVEGIEPEVLNKFSPSHFAYSRSGIHCDLHPRWRWDGRAVCFDSNHEGFRGVYTLELAEDAAQRPRRSAEAVALGDDRR